MILTSKVEAAFGSSPNDLIADQEWTDLSPRYLSHTLNRGRSDELSEMQASTYTVVLDNADGALTPGYTSSPYYPDVDMGVLLRHSLVGDIPVNMVTGNDTGFEATIGGWADAGNATLARSTSQAYEGTASLRVTSVATGTTATYLTTTPATAGEVYTASVWSRAATTGRSVRIGLAWSCNGVVIGGVFNYGPYVTDRSTGWTQVSYTATAPATTDRVLILVEYAGTVAGEQHYIDTVSLPAAASLITGDNSTFEATAGTWTGFGTATLARSTAQKLDGVASLAATAVATGISAGLYVAAGTTPVVGGYSYTMRAYVRAATTARSCRIAILYQTEDGTIIAPTWTYGTAASNTTTGWTPITVTMTSPVNAVFAGFHIEIAAAVAAEVHYFDRVTLTGPSAYTRFTGYIESIDSPNWVNSPFDKTVTIQANDRLARIGNRDAMLTALQHVTLGLNPGLYWPMSEESDVERAFPLTTTETDPLALSVGTGKMEFGAGTGVLSDPLPGVKHTPALTGDETTGYFYAGRNTNLHNRALTTTYPCGDTNAFSLSAWFVVDAKWDSAGGVPGLVIAQMYGTDLFLRVQVSVSTGKVISEYSDLGGGYQMFSGPVIAPGQLVHVVQVMSGTEYKLYVNGVPYSVAEYGATLNTSFDGLEVGRPFNGSISNVALFRSALTQANVTAMYEAGTLGLNGMRTDEAVAAVAGYVGVDATECVTSLPGSSRINNVQTVGRTGLEVLKEVAAAESGAVYVDASGVLQFVPRSSRYTATVTAVLDAAEIDDSIGVSHNNQYLVNDISVSRPGGATVRAVDAASITKRGRYAKSETVSLWNDNELAARAAYTLAAYAIPKPRLSNLPLNLTTTLVPLTLLGLDIGDLISLTGLSADAPGLGSQWVEGFTESGSKSDGYSLVLTTSPVLLTGPFWQLDVTDNLDTETIVAY